MADGFALHQPGRNAVVELLKQWREQLSAKDASISGWAGSFGEIRGREFREAAGQKVLHHRAPLHLGILRSACCSRRQPPHRLTCADHQPAA